MERQNQTVAGEGLQPSENPGFYQELSPQEFNRRKELVVLLLKAPDAGEAFTGFREVISSADSAALLRSSLCVQAGDEFLGIDHHVVLTQLIEGVLEVILDVVE